ncbi:hypothetical protein [Actinoplanes sp. NBRC 103695]|uniref:hypothetical protein n=1 Tax=Actinoplanes sp. NBRC 103695 TaxID=3032202 RepID=UPI0024A2169F|nr:hypothetical protein [Actinoplanes sp. NBRC 103695]GLZ01895.1 hypothetical protein Acsp02_91460 [Actinoplanes sp. NBRC 103695]
MTDMARRRFGRRVALDRDGVAAHTGAARSTVNHWHLHRQTTGFPDGFTDDGGHEWFWLDQITTFHTAHQAAKLAELTQIDRDGDPDELVGSGEAARIMRYSSYRNLPDELRDRPDDVERLSDGRLRRRWYRRTVWAIADARTGRQSTGRTPGSATGPRKPHPYADDPRLNAALDLLRAARAEGRGERGLGAELAARLGIAPRTAQRLLAAAEDAADAVKPAALPAT